MTKIATSGGRQEFLSQAAKCRLMGSPFVASILEAVDRQLMHAPISAAMVMGWPGDAAAAAVAMRMNGALHALARRGTPRRLAELYLGMHEDFDGAIACALSQEDTFIARWMRHAPQTNEVARAAAIMAALMTLRSQWAMPLQLLELGSSCGLNLNLAHYAYKLGEVSVGNALSTVDIEPIWRGPSPAATEVSIIAARGVDLHPLNASDPGHRERLLSFAWADQPSRSKRLEEALLIAVEHPPRIDQCDAAVWLEQHLSEPQEAGQCRAVVNTMFMQYISDGDRRNIEAMIVDAGARATSDRPLAWISFEWTEERREVQLRLNSWPHGGSVVLAKCHPYGDWIEWQSLDEEGATGPLHPSAQ